MEKIILVGNGTSVMDQPLGHLIDTYDTIVRFSYYWIDGYEQYVGSKTDIWFTTVAQKGFRSNKKYREIYEHSWQWDINKDKTYKKLKEMFPETKITKTTSDICTAIREYTKNYKYKTYSSGAIAAQIFTTLYGHVTLHGFDWWEINREKHHYGDSQTIGGIHKPEYEYQYISKLIEDGKATFLCN